MILFRLIYGRNIAYLIESYKSYNIIRYVDSNYTGNPKDRKSIISYCFFMNRAIVT